MNNLKFRQFDKRLNDFMFFELNNGCVHIINSDIESFDVDRKDSPQERFTGLTDKNGVEIYEGDIVKWQAGLVSGNNAIVYNDGSFCIDSAFQDDMSIYQSYASQGLEVIGNLHQNPELLEQNNE